MAANAIIKILVVNFVSMELGIQNQVLFDEICKKYIYLEQLNQNTSWEHITWVFILFLPSTTSIWGCKANRQLLKKIIKKPMGRAFVRILELSYKNSKIFQKLL